MLREKIKSGMRFRLTVEDDQSNVYVAVKDIFPVTALCDFYLCNFKDINYSVLIHDRAAYAREKQMPVLELFGTWLEIRRYAEPASGKAAHEWFVNYDDYDILKDAVACPHCRGTHVRFKDGAQCRVCDVDGLVDALPNNGALR